MSGGSYNYAFRHVDEMAESIETRHRSTPLRRAFAEHLKLVGKAMHAIEWVDSGDYGPGDEEAAIKAVLGPHAEALALGQLVGDAERLVKDLTDQIAKAKEADHGG